MPICLRCAAFVAYENDMVLFQPCRCLVCKDCFIDYLLLLKKRNQNSIDYSCAACSQPVQSHSRRRKTLTGEWRKEVETQPFGATVASAATASSDTSNKASSLKASSSKTNAKPQPTQRRRKLPSAMTGPNSSINNAKKKRRTLTFDERVQLLRNYKAEHGDCCIPWDHPTMGDWVKDVRRRRVKLLSDEQRRVLDELGFEWENKRDREWQNCLERLRAFHQQSGHCRVPETFDDGDAPSSLYGWCRTQRRFFHQGRLREDRRQKLEALGFDFGKQLPPRGRSEKKEVTKQDKGEIGTTTTDTDAAAL